VRERRVRGRFVPTDTRHREIVLPVRVRPHLPGRRPGPTGRILERGQGRRPVNGVAVLDEGLFPVLAAPIAARVDELLELPVGYFVGVDPVIGEIDR